MPNLTTKRRFPSGSRPRRLSVCAIAILATLLIPRAAASQEQHRLEVSPYFGYAENSGWMMGRGSGWLDAPHPGTGPTFGGRLSVRLRSETFLEVAVGYNDASGWFGGPFGPGLGSHMGRYGWAPGVSGPSLGTLAYDGNLVYGFRFSRWVPFVTAGFGALTSWPGGESARTDPIGNVGAGVKFYASDRFALRADLREYVGVLRRASESSAVWSSTRRLSGHPQVTAGLSFGF